MNGIYGDVACHSAFVVLVIAFAIQTKQRLATKQILFWKTLMLQMCLNDDQIIFENSAVQDVFRPTQYIHLTLGYQISLKKRNLNRIKLFALTWGSKNINLF